MKKRASGAPSRSRKQGAAEAPPSAPSPEVTPTVTPEVMSEVISEIASPVVRRVVPDVAPNFVPEVVSEVVPDAVAPLPDAPSPDAAPPAAAGKARRGSKGTKVPKAPEAPPEAPPRARAPRKSRKQVQPVAEPVIEQVATPVMEPVAEPVAEPVMDTEPVVEPMEPVAEPGTVAAPVPYPLRTAEGENVTVVHFTAELAPFARTGGLGEAVANLALQQVRSGLQTVIVMPLYRQVQDVVTDFSAVGEPFAVQVGPHTEYAQLYESDGLRDRADSGKPRVYFLANGHYFDREGIYGDSFGDYRDNARRWAFFSLAALRALPLVTEGPVLLHTHDWHTALAPAYLRSYDSGDPYYRRIWNVVTVHNAGFQGHFPTETMSDVGLPWEFYNHHMFEWYGRMNILKGGMACADAVTTVSPTHAHELRTPAGGFGLHEHFIAMRERFVGILNGIDNEQWDPRTDPNIAANYSRENLDPKRRCKAALQRHFRLPERPGTPIIGMSARMVSQKGLDLILGSPRFLSLDCQYIFLGQGERRYIDLLTELAFRAPERIGVQSRFTVEQEHILLAGADMIVMPSQYEPCGLTQMRAQRYGTIPVARRVGGLADTIEDNVTGFLFDDYTQDDFINACARAIDHYRHPQTWTTMVREAMARDFGWEHSEARYRDIYQHVLLSPRWRR